MTIPSLWGCGREPPPARPRPPHERTVQHRQMRSSVTMLPYSLYITHLACLHVRHCTIQENRACLPVPCITVSLPLPNQDTASFPPGPPSIDVTVYMHLHRALVTTCASTQPHQ